MARVDISIPSLSASSSDEDEEEDYETNIKCMHQVFKVTGSYVFWLMIQKITMDKEAEMSFRDYFLPKGIYLDKCESGSIFLHFDLPKPNLDETDPWKNPTDITLLFKCFQRVDHDMVVKDKSIYKDGLDCMKMLLNKMAALRSDFDRKKRYTKHQLLSVVRDNRKPIIDIVRVTGALFSMTSEKVGDEILNLDIMTSDTLSQFMSTSDVLESCRRECLKKPKVNLVVNKEIEVTHLRFDNPDMFVEMELKCKSSGFTLTFEDIVQQNFTSTNNHTVVIEGIAGVGKTTLMKKVVFDWQHMKLESSISLLSFFLLVDVDCRNSHIKTFPQMLEHLMPKVAENIKGEELKDLVLGQKILVILDGYDEMNKSSSLLCDEILKLKKMEEELHRQKGFSMKLIITSRPEKILVVKQRLRSLKIKATYYQLMGIPIEKTGSFVSKFSFELDKKCDDGRSLAGLQSYLDFTEHKLGELWKVPYNLNAICFIWAFDPEKAKNIKSSSQLHSALFDLYYEQLKLEIVARSPRKKSVSVDKDLGLENFFSCLSKEAAIGLKSNCFHLTGEAHEGITEDLSNLKVPIENIVSQFLRSRPNSDDLEYPHRVFQDYLSAYDLWSKITGKYANYNVKDIIKNFGKILVKNDVPFITRNKVIRKTRSTFAKKVQTTTRHGKADVNGPPGKRLIPAKESSTIIRDCIEEIPGPSHFDLSIFQNVLSMLTGMFYTKEAVVEGKIKLEALTLLWETGMRDRDAWVNLLTSVNCNDYVASFICKLPNFLEGDILITDFSCQAYISIMQSLALVSSKNSKKVRIHLDIVCLTGIEKLLKLIHAHQFKLMSICIDDRNSEGYSTFIKDMQIFGKGELRIKADLSINDSFYRMIPLINLLNEKNFNITSLRLKNILIADLDIEAFVCFLKFVERHRHINIIGGIKVVVQKETSNVLALLELIEKRNLAVEIRLHYHFRHLKINSQLHRPLNQILSRSLNVQQYVGPMLPNMKLTGDASNLHLSVTDNESYQSLMEFLQTDPKFKKITICMRHDLDSHSMRPLKVYKKNHFAALMFPDLTNREEFDNVAQIIKKMQPEHEKGYCAIFFPRCTLKPEDLALLLKKMYGVKTKFVYFSSECEPACATKKKEIEKMSTRELSSKYGAEWIEFEDENSEVTEQYRW